MSGGQFVPQSGNSDSKPTVTPLAIHNINFLQRAPIEHEALPRSHAVKISVRNKESPQTAPKQQTEQVEHTHHQEAEVYYCSARKILPCENNSNTVMRWRQQRDTGAVSIG